jgi:hypothetical protein
MRRILGLWLLLLVIELAAFLTIGGVALREVNLRFDAILGALLAPAMQAVLLVAFVRALRDRHAASPREALQAKGVVPVAGFILAAILLVTAANVLRLVPNRTFDYARGGMLLAAALTFARSRRYSATPLFAILGVLSGHFEQLSEHVFPTQPLIFRWLVFFVPVTVLVLVALLAITKNRGAGTWYRGPGAGNNTSASSTLEPSADNRPPITDNRTPAPGTRHPVPHTDASKNALLETALAPAAAAAIIIASNYYLRPFIPPTWLLLANILGVTAAGIVLLAGVASAARRP